MIQNLFAGFSITAQSSAALAGLVDPYHLTALVLGCVGSLPVLEPLRKAAQSRPALEAASYPAALVLLALDLIHLSAATFVPFIYFQF